LLDGLFEGWVVCGGEGAAGEGGFERGFVAWIDF
jgi:hypothetical protein